uniref:Hylaseptin-P1 n=1 Tax=Boana punctata TaxID=2499473 RepID=HLP1_BOAPU|nr:RecName: Full=Hylaseptin-P1; Short=HSP1 [Boana punctata]
GILDAIKAIAKAAG